MDTALAPPASLKVAFVRTLLQWHEEHPRPLPWKATRDPYAIWLSEIILQQTRVEQGLPYFQKFIQAFPTVAHLAKADEDTVFKLWEGLGYYSRARNLHATARHIVEMYDGIFPTAYADIRALKGVGDYTAAAIASFAFDLPYAVVDGNVYRVLSRVAGIHTPIDSTAGRKEFATLAQQLLPPSAAAAYNQAIMDFGATQCTPVPRCATCPMQDFCIAYREQLTALLPVKEKRQTIKRRFFHYFLIKDVANQVLIQKRAAKDVWQGLYELPLTEVPSADTPPRLPGAWQQQGAVVENVSTPLTQQLSHQHITAIVAMVRLPHLHATANTPYLCVPYQELSQYAFPKILDFYFKQGLLSLFGT